MTFNYAVLPREYEHGGALVFPALAGDWGLVVNEAMAAGLPVLGSVYDQAVEELVVGGENGWTFRPDRPGEVYSKLDPFFAASELDLNRVMLSARETALRLVLCG